ncbi:N-acetyl-1-D-myo-inositol-2-amino-2-deoxy-alpha-D-glucopyranoside deacetylase [Jiangella rhizosphaerae]|uniref:1D-myo-inositol 2-acetamido-2-deoxy-alpha-D-glucopyranoside deacetylase n=1 Tax=Jiangella rhizosphaerae TaxID=2293569 RepID=A0A418KPB1_9ACTN|nr:N-acetyl-1-D-myo-inositol-2-amino-2-deoxy-alpha-D-glucopyranoside deacetylase [Jiangella rhizosphaerae]RIQ21213.1 N-acetyl-1-D-myo-inositol-2-amino-2-deoxy-alpha-D-glucopyranoside deacetylase [Jiangella rhizosphaerae]
MPVDLPERRLLLVHAHPDDESIGTGATMARYAAEGAHVTLVTCTQGEQGEIVLPELAHLAPEHDDALGPHRAGELADAMAQLKVTDHRFLGGPGRYRDSGMVWGPDGRRAAAPEQLDPRSFWAADLREAADHLVAVIREVRPQVLVTYDEHGGYGHPDHIQAHRVATYARDLAAVRSYRTDLGPAWDVAKVYWTATPRQVLQEALTALRERGGTGFENIASADDFGYVVDLADVDAVVDGSDHLDAKLAAMRAHATQIDVQWPYFTLSDNVGQPIWAQEYFRLAHGRRGPADPATGVETDLFAGVAP